MRIHSRPPHFAHKIYPLLICCQKAEVGFDVGIIEPQITAVPNAQRRGRERRQ